MNIPNKFDLYLENKLSKVEKDKFERELSEQPELAESYKAYSQIDRILKSELHSPLLNSDDDPLLKDLSISQRLAIEEDFTRFYSKEIQDQDGNSPTIEGEKITGQNNPQHLQTDKRKADIEKDEHKFLQLLNKAASNKSLVKNKIINLYIGIAAAVVLSFFAGKIIFGLNLTGSKKLSPQQAYAFYYNPKADRELKSLNFIDARLKTVFLDFNRSNISTSGIFSNQMEVSDDDYELSLLYLGIIYLERNDFQEARKCFTKILSSKNQKKTNTADFYLSLAYLSEGNFADAAPLLDKLTQTQNPYRKKAKAILRTVKP